MARPIEKRRFIEEGVVRVVAEKGLKGTTIQDIADAAKVSPGLLYRYWKNRDDLAGEVYREHTLALLGRLMTVGGREKGVMAQARSMLGAFLRYADEQPLLLKFLLLSQHDMNSSIPEEQGLHNFVKRVVAAGMDEGCFRRMDVDLASAILLGIVLQPTIAAVYGHVARPVAQHADTIMGAVERALGRAPQSGTPAGEHRAKA
jgi:AcrR family transcriptional regulator